MLTMRKGIVQMLLTVAAVLILHSCKEAKPAETVNPTEKFAAAVEHFNILEEMSLTAMRLSDTTSRESYMANLKETALPNWAECINVLDLAEKLELPASMENYRLHLIDYSNQRLQQTLLLIKAYEQPKGMYQGSIDSIQQKINEAKSLATKERKKFNLE